LSEAYGEGEDIQLKREQKPEKIYYEKFSIRISRDELNWKVATLGKRGKDAAVPGEETAKGITYHGTLAQACSEAALRMADAGEKASLRAYWSDLTAAIAGLKAHFREPARIKTAVP
jgi:hypothetical protein